MSGSAAAISPDPAPPNLDDIYEAAGREWGVDSNLLRSVAGVESSGNVNTPDSHPSGGRPGAQGLMQLWPPTSKSLGVTDPYDPPQAIFGAAKLLSQNLDRYGNVEDALRAYNGGTDPAKWSNPETAAYPGKVAAIYGRITGSQGGNAPPIPKPYQVASADTGTMSDIAPPPDAPPRAGPAAGMDLAPHPDSGAPVDVTALPPADFFKLTTGGQAPAAANSNAPAAPPDVTAMSPADFFKATTAPAGSAPAADGSTDGVAPGVQPRSFWNQDPASQLFGQGVVSGLAGITSKLYSAGDWANRHLGGNWDGTQDSAADDQKSAQMAQTYADQQNALHPAGSLGSGVYNAGNIAGQVVASLPLGEGVGAVARGVSMLGKAIPSVGGRLVQGAGNLLSGDTGATTVLGRAASASTAGALQGGIVAGVQGDSPVQGAEWGAGLGTAGELVAPVAGKFVRSVINGTPGTVDRGLTAIGAPPRPAALPAPEPLTTTQRWANMPAPPSAEPIPAGTAAEPSQPAAPAFNNRLNAAAGRGDPPPVAAAPPNALAGAPAPAAPSAAPADMTPGMRSVLSDLGFSDGDIAAMRPDQAQMILKHGITPDQWAPVVVPPAPSDSVPSALVNSSPGDYGNGRQAPSYDANRLTAVPTVAQTDEPAAPTFSINRLQAAVPVERADPVIGAPGVAPPISPEIHAATEAMLNPQPQSMGAAASSRDASNPVPPMSAREAAASRNTGNLQRLTESVPSGRDTTIYVPGSTPTEAEVAGDASVSRQQEAIRQKNPQPFEDQWNKNNLARVDHFEEHMGTDDTVRLAEEARDAQAEQDLASAWANKGEADAQPVADLGQQILAGRMGKLPPVRDAVGKALDGLYDADGNLETDPEMLYGARDNIAYLLSKTAQQEKPGLAKATAQLMQLKDALDGVIEKAAPGYKQYLANYAAASKPIDTQQILQSFRPSLTDGRGTMTLQRVKNMMTAIVKAQKAPGVNPAKSIDPDTMEALWNIRDDLRRLDNRDLGKARGSDTNQISWFGKKLGLAGMHVAVAHVAPVYGNMGLTATQNMLEQRNIRRMTNKLTNPTLDMESDRNAP